MKIRLLALGWFIVVAVMSWTASIRAGYKAPLGVFVFPHNLQGSLGAARASPDNVQYLGCQLYAGTVGTSGMCFANTRDRVYKACYFTDPRMIQVVSSLTTASYIHVDFDDRGYCTDIAINTDSGSPPMVP